MMNCIFKGLQVGFLSFSLSAAWNGFWSVCENRLTANKLTLPLMER